MYKQQNEQGQRQPFKSQENVVFGQKEETIYIECQKCNFDNDISNFQCVSCDSLLYPSEETIECNICSQNISIQKYENHLSACEESMKIIIQEQKAEEQKIKKIKEQKYCKYCFGAIENSQLLEHEKKCFINKGYKAHYPLNNIPVVSNKNNQKFASIKTIQCDIHTILHESELLRLTYVQLQALNYMYKNGIFYHNQNAKKFGEKMKSLGYNQEVLMKLRQYIQLRAPIVIHVNLSKYMLYFVSDSNYRSLFQTNESAGTKDKMSRKGKQDKIFNNTYSKASDFERVKYGVMNLTNDPQGVKQCLNYGKSHFVLKPHVRPRCTITSQNSFSSTLETMGVLKYCFHILGKLNDSQLHATVKAALGSEESSSVSLAYKEVQIHGPVDFSQDVESIRIHKSEVQNDENLENVLAFIQKNGIEYQFI